MQLQSLPSTIAVAASAMPSGKIGAFREFCRSPRFRPPVRAFVESRAPPHLRNGFKGTTLQCANRGGKFRVIRHQAFGGFAALARAGQNDCWELFRQHFQPGFDISSYHNDHQIKHLPTLKSNFKSDTTAHGVRVERKILHAPARPGLHHPARQLHLFSTAINRLSLSREFFVLFVSFCSSAVSRFIAPGSNRTAGDRLSCRYSST